MLDPYINLYYVLAYVIYAVDKSHIDAMHLKRKQHVNSL